MKIELILIGVIAIVFLVDFIVKRRKKGLIIPKQKTQFSKKNKIVLIILLLSTIVSSLLIYTYNPLFIFDKDDGVSVSNYLTFDRYNIDEVLKTYKNNELTYVLKNTMDKFTGIVYSPYGNNGIVIDGNANGIFTFHHFEKGKKVSLEKSNFEKGKLEGDFKEWSVNGQLIVEANYKNGKLNGNYKEWSDNGKLAVEVNYDNGEKNGLYNEWFNNGQLKIKSNYLNGILNGNYERWSDDGKLVVDANYVEGKLDGAFKKMKSNYSPSVEIGNYENGEKVGEWVEIYHDKWITKGKYLNGKKNGWWSVYEEKNNDNVFKLNFKNGIFHRGVNLFDQKFSLGINGYADYTYQDLVNVANDKGYTLNTLISKNDLYIAIEHYRIPLH